MCAVCDLEQRCFCHRRDCFRCGSSGLGERIPEAGGEWKAPLPVRRERHMLVLRRKAGEAIVLNGTITIHVLAVEGERVKLGISAPPDVVIVRSELLDGPMMGSNPSASSASGPLGAPSLPPGGSGSYTRPPMPRGPGASGSGWRAPDTSSWRQ